MKISNSKKALAKVINENGGWLDVANWAAQDRCDLCVEFYTDKPERSAKSGFWDGISFRKKSIKLGKIINNWHQTCLSREEYFSAYPEESAADADGWIEWNGGECPVGADDVVDVRQLNGREYTAIAENFHWMLKNGPVSVASYRLHKPEANHELCKHEHKVNQDRVFAIEESEHEEKPSGAKFTQLRSKSIEQLAADYRNKLDYANRKQQEADDAKAAADAALGELGRAGEALGLLIGIAKLDTELVITDWRDLQVGDIVFVESMREENEWSLAMVGYECLVISDGDRYPICFVNDFTPDGKSYWIGGADDGEIDWRFIRRP